MLDAKYVQSRLPKMLVPAYHLMTDEEKFSQVLSEIAGLKIEQIIKTKTNAGYFAYKLSSLYNTDVIIIKEGITKTGSIALVYWKEWAKFSLLKYRKTKSTYSLINYDFDGDFTKIIIEKYHRSLK